MQCCTTTRPKEKDLSTCSGITSQVMFQRSIEEFGLAVNLQVISRTLAELCAMNFEE